MNAQPSIDTEPERVTRLDYGQYLLSSQINYTLTNFADHTEQFSHDAINRYLAGDRIAPRLVWENAHPRSSRPRPAMSPSTIP